MLANIYLHYALDLWLERMVRKQSRGGMVYLRYADDFVTGFELEEDARACYARLPEGLDKFEALALAWHLYTDPEAGSHAVRLVDAWFLAAATRMTPHLEFAQEIRGLRTGSGIGIIGLRKIVLILDAVRALRNHPGWTPQRDNAFSEWIREYRGWLIRSGHGRVADEQHNNHGTFYDFQLVHLCLFLGDEEKARNRLRSSLGKRLPTHVAEDGSQPHEEMDARALLLSGESERFRSAGQCR